MRKILLPSWPLASKNEVAVVKARKRSMLLQDGTVLDVLFATSIQKDRSNRDRRHHPSIINVARQDLQLHWQMAPFGPFHTLVKSTALRSTTGTDTVTRVTCVATDTDTDTVVALPTTDTPPTANHTSKDSIFISAATRPLITVPLASCRFSWSCYRYQYQQL
jgi:hypothetical protein